LVLFRAAPEGGNRGVTSGGGEDGGGRVRVLSPKLYAETGTGKQEKPLRLGLGGQRTERSGVSTGGNNLKKKGLSFPERERQHRRRREVVQEASDKTEPGP